MALSHGGGVGGDGGKRFLGKVKNLLEEVPESVSG